MELWQRVWRDGMAPQLSIEGLEALRLALTCDEPRLLQGMTCNPPALQALSALPVEAACAIGYCGWRGEGLTEVGPLEDYFQSVCDGADAVLAERAACRFFLNWYDDTPRDAMRRQLLAEVNEVLQRRQTAAA